MPSLTIGDAVYSDYATVIELFSCVHFDLATDIGCCACFILFREDAIEGSDVLLQCGGRDVTFACVSAKDGEYVNDFVCC